MSRFQLATAFGLLIYLTAFFNSTSLLLKTEIFVFIFLTLINMGAIMEKKNYLFRLELLRLWQLSLFASFYFSYPAFFLLFSVLLITSLLLLPLKRWYYETVLRTSLE